MSTAQPFLPSTLPLLPLPPPQVLYPGLQVTIPLSYAHLRVVLDSINQNDREQKVEESSRMVAVVPVMEIERRIGRWACGQLPPVSIWRWRADILCSCSDQEDREVSQD